MGWWNVGDHKAELPCPEPGCYGTMRRKESKYGKFYGCSNYPNCRATHGAHPNGMPLGVPATEKVKRLRMKAHDLAEEIWPVQDRAGKKAFYLWLQKVTGLTRAEAHISMFGEDRLLEVISELEREKGEMNRAKS